MTKHIKIQLDRVGELLKELEDEYNKSLSLQKVSDRALVITHEVVEKLSNLLDQIANKIWLKEVGINLTEEEKIKVGKRIYFPAQTKKEDFDNKLVEWKAKDAENNYPNLYKFFKKLQPFNSQDNLWIKYLKELASKKHVDLIPQKKQVITNITYSNANGTVMFNAESVQFGAGASILGAPVDPITQRIVPTPGVNEKMEKWVSFKPEGYDLDSLGFCKNGYSYTMAIIEDARKIFSLS